MSANKSAWHCCSWMLCLLVCWLAMPPFAVADEIGLRTGYAFRGWGRLQDKVLLEAVYETALLTNWRLAPSFEVTAGTLRTHTMSSAGVLATASSLWTLGPWSIGAGIGGITSDTLGGPVFFRLQTGLDIPLTARWHMSVAYHHLSNASMYARNPGLDMGMVALHYRW